jgi:hypothetical protein
VASNAEVKEYTMEMAELTALLTGTRSCQEGVGLYRVSFGWVDWYAKRASIVYKNGEPQLEPVGLVAWDMSTAVHSDSPTLTMGEVWTGPLCAHEVQILKTGRDDNSNVASPRWVFTVESTAPAEPTEPASVVEALPA